MNRADSIIRPAREEDAPVVAGIAAESYRTEYLSQGLSEGSIREMDADNSSEKLAERIRHNYYFVAVDRRSGEFVGFIGLRQNDGRKLFNRISTFFLIPSCRGKRIGSLLYQTVLGKAREFRVPFIGVNSSLTAEAIYAHWGFQRKEVRITLLSNGEVYKNIWMEKSLLK